MSESIAGSELVNKEQAMSNNEQAEPTKPAARQRRSPNPQMGVDPHVDRRIRRTHARLGSALVELIREKPIDAITVQQVLDRAKVGRSTFYLHFRDKDDLLFSQLEMFLETMSTMLLVRKEASLRVMPVTEMFAHIGTQNRIYRALAESGQLHDFFDLAQGYFTRGIVQRLKDTRRLGKLPKRELDARASALAGSLITLLRWWIDHSAKETPETMDALFHGMVWSGIRFGCASPP